MSNSPDSSSPEIMLGEKADGYLKIIIYIIFIVLAVLLLVFGFLIEHLRSPAQAENTEGYGWRLFAHLLSEGGIAVLIAFCLAVTIERISKRELARIAAKSQDMLSQNAIVHQRRLQQSVFHYIYGHSLPKEVVAEIEAQLLQSCFVRHAVTVRHRISAFQHDPKYVLVMTYLDYEVRNLTPNDQTFPCTILTEQSPCASFANDVGIKTLSVKVDKGISDFYDANSILPHCSTTQVGGHIYFEKEYTVPSEGSAHISVQFASLKFHQLDYEIFTNTQPACGFQIIVELDSSVDDLEVHAHSFHPEDFVEGGGHNPAQGQYRWAIPNPVLCSQGGFVMWKRKEMLPVVIPEAPATSPTDPMTPQPLVLNPPTKS